MLLIETLEARTLFSATVSQALLTDLSNLTSDVFAAKTAYQQYSPTLRSDLQTLRADVKAAGQRTGTVLMAKLNAASLHFFNATRAETLRLFASDSLAARIGFEDALLLSIHPNNVRLQTKVTADEARFNTSAAARVNKLATDGATLSAASASALDAVSTTYADNTAVTNDVAKLQSDGSAFLSALGPSLQAGQTDLVQFLSDVAARK